jgi:hypothetical protein
MRKVFALGIVLLLLSCVKKQHANNDSDFTDKVLTFAINNADDKYIELPELYESAASFIPETNDDHVILSDKLQLRGFKVTAVKRIDRQLLGRRILAVTLKNDSCQCEVDKTYYTTQNISQYLVTERIKCNSTSGVTKVP